MEKNQTLPQGDKRQTQAAQQEDEQIRRALHEKLSLRMTQESEKKLSEEIGQKQQAKIKQEQTSENYIEKQVAGSRLQAFQEQAAHSLSVNQAEYEAAVQEHQAARGQQTAAALNARHQAVQQQAAQKMVQQQQARKQQRPQRPRKKSSALSAARDLASPSTAVTRRLVGKLPVVGPALAVACGVAGFLIFS